MKRLNNVQYVSNVHSYRVNGVDRNKVVALYSNNNSQIIFSACFEGAYCTVKRPNYIL